ncbi:MAG: hypothetical protein LKF69_03775 [Bacilli bacterium]|jgi:phosphotransferase system IIB component|nr:hypothetical protein [Bacilli bacterium]MCH4235900.1 hypothetical protein [Bacilli bacterium]
MANEINDFLYQYGLYIALGIAALLAIILLIYFFSHRSIKPAASLVSSSQLIEALGGADNIKEISFVRSRMSIYLYEQTKLNRFALDQLGFGPFVQMSDRLTLLTNEATKKTIIKTLEQYKIKISSR